MLIGICKRPISWIALTILVLPGIFAPGNNSATAKVTGSLPATGGSAGQSNPAISTPGDSRPPSRPNSNTWCVDATGGATGGAPCTNDPAFTSIQATVEMTATEGDEIRIAQGTYTGSGSSVVTITTPLTLTGGYTGGAGGWNTFGDSILTAIDGEGARRGIQVQGAIAPVIQNLSVDNGGILNNSGTVQVLTGHLNLRDGGTSSGVFDIASGATVDFPGGRHTLDGGTAFTGAGAARILGGAVTVSGTTTAQNLELAAGDLEGSGTLTTTGIFDWTGDGSFISMDTTGVIAIAVGATMNISGSGFRDFRDGTLSNAGTINWTGTADIYMRSGATIDNTGLFDVENDQSLYWCCASPPTINNTGTFRKSAGTGASLVSNTIFNNSGSVQVLTGTLALSGGGASSGMLYVGGGASVTFDSSAYSFGAASVTTGGGTIGFNSGTATFEPGATYNITGTTSIDGGAAYFNNQATTASASLSNGSLNGSGILTTTGSFDWTGDGSIIAMNYAGGTGVAAIAVGATMNISGSGFRDFRDGTLRNLGTVNWTGTADIYMSGGATIDNIGLFDVQNGQSLYWCCASPAGINNTGTFRKSAGSATSAIQSPFNNSGSVQVLTGTLALSGGGAGSGMLYVAQGAAVVFNGSAYSFDAASVTTGGGTIGFNSGTTTFEPGATYNITGTTSIDGGAAYFNNRATTASASLSNGSLNGSGIFTTTGSFDWTGDGSLIYMDATGVIAIPVGATMNISGSGFRDFRDGTLHNAGTVNWTGTTDIYMNGGATIDNIGLFDVENDQSLYWCCASPPTINNTGTFRKSAGTGASLVSNTTFNNSSTGSVQVLTGTLAFSGGGASSGMLYVAQGAGVTFDNSAYSFDAASVTTGGGTIGFNSGTATFEPGATYSITGTTSIDGGAAYFNNRATTSSASLSNGSLRGSGVLTTTGTFDWTGDGTFIQMDGTGIAAIAVGATMNIGGSGDRYLYTGILRNAGTVNWTGATNIYISLGATLNNTGTFDVQNDQSLVYCCGSGQSINNTGTFRKSAGSGTSTVEIPFTNSGSVQVLTGTLNFAGSYAQTAGATNLAGGNIGTGSVLNIQGGSLIGAGTITGDVTNAAGQISPGSSPGSPATGVLTITGNYTQSPSGTLRMDIGGLTPGTQHDRLTVGGVAALNGTLNISVTNGFTPTNGNSFQVINYGSQSGTFATYTGLNLGNGRALHPNYNPTNLTLSVAPIVLVVHVTWQGIPQPSSRNTTETVTMTLRLAGGGPANEYTGMTTDANGYFSVPVGSLPDGTYNIRVKGLRNLSNGMGVCADTVTLRGGLVNSYEAGVMRAGDAESVGPTNFNLVNAADFTTLKATFGKSYGQFGYDARADFNNTDHVDSTDFILLRLNFGLAGCGAVGPMP